jgi:2-polyprenyl-3-methyl-5-hydroxy-6-metoxy-1,4-benzoquinol methylase
MNYDEQRKYLGMSYVVGGVLAIPFFFTAAFLWVRPSHLNLVTDPYVAAAIALAIAFSIIYTPNYLHLTVTPDKPIRWQVRIRWRIAAVVLILSAAFAETRAGAITGAAAAAILIAVNLFGKRFSNRPWMAEVYFATDFILFWGCYAHIPWNTPWAFLVPAAIFHVWAVMGGRHCWYATLTMFVLLPVLLLEPMLWFMGLFVLASVLATSVLVGMAQRRHRLNRGVALNELTAYTGRSADDVVRMWQTSNQQLAANWEAAKLDENDREGLKKWYADNSELYLFAISAYNLEYRRIKSNLFVLQYGRGHALDYGAGNGELVLEIARRGQRAAYYDVDGATLRFAKWRAERRGLDVEFFTEKEKLGEWARQHPFDTVFSFDVLEHIPDLAAELDFLSSLLAPGGQMVFDLPTGATKAHPMHLEHRLDFGRHLEARGLRERKRWLDYVPFRKQEKFVFVREKA